MNKKFYLLFAIGFFIATQSFAMKSFSDFGISYHLLSETGQINTDDGLRTAITNISSISLDINPKLFPNTDSKVGFGILLNWYFPLNLNINLSDGRNASLSSSDFNKIYGLSFLFGPSINPINKEKFSLLITPGICINSLFMDAQKINSFTLLFGLGAEVSTNFHLSNGFFLKLGLDYRYYFFHFGSESSGSELAYTLQPKIGFGRRI